MAETGNFRESDSRMSFSLTSCVPHKTQRQSVGLSPQTGIECFDCLGPRRRRQFLALFLDWNWNVQTCPLLQTDAQPPGSSLWECLCAQSRPVLGNHTYCSPPGSSLRGTFQARILEWVAISSSRGSSNPEIKPVFLAYPTPAGGFFYHLGWLGSTEVFLIKWKQGWWWYCWVRTARPDLQAFWLSLSPPPSTISINSKYQNQDLRSSLLSKSELNNFPQTASNYLHFSC